MLIGLNGKLRSGKDTVYKRMVVRGAKPERIAFADKLKRSAAACLGISVEVLEALKEDGGTIEIILPGGFFKEITVRQYLQWFGTEGHRMIFGDDFWLDAILPIGTNHEDEFLVVTDVRFPNEVHRILDLGGVIWRVNASDSDATVTHVSEQYISDAWIDVEIDNTIRDDNFANLDRQIEEALNDYVYG